MLENESRKENQMEKMPKQKTITSLILLLLLLISLIVFIFCSLRNSTVEAKGYFLCKLTSSGYEIVGLTPDAPQDIVIPTDFDNTPVIRVASSICSNLPIKSITVPPSVNSIADKAFESINSLIIFMDGRENADGMKLGREWSGDATVIFGDAKVNIGLLSSDKLPQNNEDDSSSKPTSGNDNDEIFISPIQPDNTNGQSEPQKNDNSGNTVTNKNPNGGFEIGSDNNKTIKTLSSISIAIPPIKTEYVEGNTFDKTGLLIRAHYSDGTSTTTDDYSVISPPLLISTTAVVVSYTDKGITKNTSQAIKVVKKTPTKLEVVTPPNKTRYIEGNVFDKTGMVVKVSYDNGDTANITSFAVPTDKLIKGETSVTLSYKENNKEVTATQSITVVAKTPTKLEITTPPTKTRYIEGNVFDKTGMVVKVYYDNGDAFNIIGFVVPTEKLMKGETSVTVSYEENNREVIAPQLITVVAKTPTKLEVVTPPNKTSYIEGNIFDKIGMVVKVSYDNGDTANITSFVAPTDKLIKGETSVTVSYKENNKEVTVTQPITVVAKTPTKLDVTKQPTKTSYSAGLIFRPDGMIVTVTYDNGDVINVTGYTYPLVRLLEGQTVVKISYIENNKLVTDDVRITVGPQLAVYEKYNCVLTTCSTCSGRGTTTSTGTCGSCGGRGSWSGSETCGGCSGSGKVWVNNGSICGICGSYYPCSSHPGGPSANDGGYWTCGSCYGSGSVNRSHTCGSCGGSGSRTTTSTCSTCKGSGNHGYVKGTYLSDVTVTANSLPANGNHTDGSWYILKHLIQDDIPTKSYKKKNQYITLNIFK